MADFFARCNVNVDANIRTIETEGVANIGEVYFTAAARGLPSCTDQAAVLDLILGQPEVLEREATYMHGLARSKFL